MGLMHVARAEALRLTATRMNIIGRRWK